LAIHPNLLPRTIFKTSRGETFLLPSPTSETSFS